MLENEAMGTDSQGDDSPQDEAVNDLLKANGIPDVPESEALSADETNTDDDDDDDDEDAIDDEDLCNKLQELIEDDVVEFEKYYEEQMGPECTVKSITFDKHGAVMMIDYFTEEELEN